MIRNKNDLAKSNQCPYLIKAGAHAIRPKFSILFFFYRKRGTYLFQLNVGLRAVIQGLGGSG